MRKMGGKIFRNNLKNAKHYIHFTPKNRMLNSIFSDL